MKNFLLFNQLFGTVGSPNQTGETLTRENRVGLMSYLRRTLMLLFAVLTLSIANIGTAWGDQGVDYSSGFENGTDSWSASSMSGGVNSETTNVRTGGKAIRCGCSNASGYARKSVTVHRQSTNYIHFIIWAKSSTATTAQIKSAGGTAVNVSVGTSDWTRMVATTSVTGSGTTNKNMDVLPKMASGSFYLDDAIVYYSTNETADITAPEAATSASASTSSISWTNGSDANTGIQNTLIWRRTSGSSDDLTLNAQGVYAASATDQSGHWTCVSATVGAAATSYSGTFSGGDRYAIVHRDLAYNYSTPTYVTVAGGAPCSDETGLAYGTGTVNKVYGDAVFTNTLTNPNSLAVTYSSTNTSVATVNPSTGAVTIAGAGTTTIKATWAGNASYCEDEVTYTLNVKPNAGSVTGAWDRFGGETIDLSVSPTGGSSYTYQWQKYNGSGWDNVSNGIVSGATTTGATSANLQIANCGGGNSGTYRCQVTAGGQTNETDGLQVKVFTLECYNGGTTVYNFTRDGENQRGSVEIDLSASTAYTFKFHVDNIYYGNNGSIHEDITNYVFCNSDNGGNCAVNFTVNSGLGGTFTFTMDYSTGGNSNVLGEPELSVTYPRKRIYLSPGVWDADGAKFAYYYFRDGGSSAWTDFLTSTDCGRYADIPQWNGVKVIAGRINGALDAPAFGDGKCWNQTGNLTVTSNDYIVVNNWDNITYNSTYSVPTYAISYNAGTGGSGSKANETKTCGVDFTLPNSAVFERTGYTQTGWTTSDGGVQTHALGGTYTTNAAQAFYPVWTVNNYDLTWNLGGGTTTSAGTGIASGVSANTTSSVAYGTSLTAPTVTKANYTFSAWSPTVASTMPAANTTYTATFTANQYSVTHSLTNMSTTSGSTGSNAATYGTNYSAVLAADDGYTLPATITVTAGATDITANCTWNSSTGAVSIPGSYITGNITITAAGVEDEPAGDCEDEYNAPSTTTYATKTFLDVSATNYNTSASTNYYLTYSAYWMHNTYKTWTWWNSNDAGSNKDASTYTYATAASEGYLATAASADGNNGYGGKKIHLTRRDSIWFTGATSVACLNKGNNSATFTMEVFQVASNGTLSKVGSSYTNATTSVTSLVSSTLSASNYYLVKFYATAASNTYLYQVRFGNACASAPSCTAVAAPTSLTCSAQTSSSLTFTWTKASNASTYTAKLYSDSGCESQVASQDLGDVATVTFSTLSASTTYYCKVQSHGDGSTYCAAGGTTSAQSGTTSAACTDVSISTQPTTPVAATVGSACSITGLVAAGTSPTYQWYTCNSDGSSPTAINAAGAMSFTGYTTATLGLTPTAAGATYYKCVVSGSCGDPVTSNVVTVNASAAEEHIYYYKDATHYVSSTYKNPEGNNAGSNDNTALTSPWTICSGPCITGLTSVVATSAKYDGKSNHINAYIKLRQTDGAKIVFTIASGYKATIKIKMGGYSSNPTVTMKLNDAGDNIAYSGTMGGVATTENNFSELTYSNLAAGAYTLKPTSGNVYISQIDVETEEAAPEVTEFSPASGSSVKTGTSITITGTTGSTIYYKWATSAQTANDIYNSGSGSHGTADAATASTTVESGKTLYAIARKGSTNSAVASATYTIDDTAPTLSSSNPADGATDVATSGTIVLTFSEAIASVDGSKFTLTGATKGAVAIDGSDATKVNIAYSGAANEATVTLATAAAAVSDAAGNSSAALSDISFTTVAAGACDEEPHNWTVVATSQKSYKVRISKVSEEVTIPVADATSKNITAYAGTVSTNDNVTVNIADGGSSNYGYKFESSNTYLKLVFSSALVQNDTLVVEMTDASKNISFTTTAVRATTYSTSSGKLIIPAALAGQTTLYLWRGSGSTMYLKRFKVLHTCDAADKCTVPVIPTLEAKTLCPGETAASAWDATATNAAAISAAGESVAYEWKKKGSDTPVSSVATYTPSSVTESMAGTYVVTATVTKAGKASSSASKEVTLTVTAAVETPEITANKATVYPGNSVTLTATCGTAGVTWNWYLCANADGTGAGSSLGTESTYTIASAGAAGTYYYKAVATGTCGSAEHVYTLTVTAASECENYFWFVYAADATTNGVVNNRSSFFSSTNSADGNTGTYTITIDEVDYTATKRLSAGAYAPKFTVPESKTATLYVYGKANGSGDGKHLVIKRTSDNEVMEVTNSTTVAAYSLASIPAGEWTLSCGSGNNWQYSVIAVKLCGASSCTDATPTIAAVNNTVCSGTKMRIDATGYEAGATFKWQKLNTSTSSWDDVAEATLDSLVIASVTASNAGSYRLIATKGCARTSNTVTIAVPSVPVFGAVPSSVTVMQTIALSITTVEASDAVKYRWYKSADATWDAGDAEICDTKNLLKPYDGEAVGNNAYYVFCRAQNACGITTSSAIAVNVTAYVAEDCAEKGNEGEAQFSFENTSCGSGNFPNTSTPCWNSNSRSKYLTYTAPDGKYLKTAKVTVAVSSGSKCGYAYSTNSGSTWTYAELSSLSSTLTEKTIDLSGSNVTDFRISRNLQDGGGTDYGVTSGTFYLSKACFEYNEACTSTTVTPSTASTSYTIGGAWDNPTFSLTPAAVSGETLTYSSSNEDIATVDDDGTVNFQGMAGTVTITASYAGGEVSSTQYCASSGSYTITVSCSGDRPKIVPGGTVNMSGCNSSVTLNAKMQDGTSDFSPAGTYQWYLDGEAISGATSASYTAVQAGVYTVERTYDGCTSLSSNSAIVTSETTEPEVERLVPFQYYHKDKTYSNQMKMRHLFAVKNSGKLDGKSFKMYVSRNGGDATDVTSSNALVVWPNGDGHVDTVMVDLNKLSGKYSENDELVFTCKAIDCEGEVSETYKNTITMHVIGSTPTLALILDGKGSVVGGDFLEDYEPKNLQERTGSKTWSGEWPMYTDLKAAYNVTPVNGYAPFNKLNYEPFDIIFMTDFPKASKSDATKTLLDDMYELVDYRPMFSFKTHMLWKSPSKWASKGFTAAPVVPKGGDGRTKMNIVCYAHPMFEAISGNDGTETQRDASDPSQIVYKMLSDVGYENSKGIQGFEIDAAENFVTIGLIHYNAGSTDGSPSAGQITWSPNAGDRMLVAACERQANPEARMILLSLNAGAHSKLTAKGRLVVMKSLEYLIQTSGGLIEPADCSYTFDNGAGYTDYDAAAYSGAGLSGAKGDGKWSTEANWGPGRNALPGQFTSVRIAAPVEVDIAHAHVMEVRTVEGGSITIPAGKGLEVTSTVRHMDGAAISPTQINELTLEASTTSNGTLIFNNNTGDTKATVWLYSKGYIDGSGNKNYQYIGTPFNEINALYNYYGSWIYRWGYDENKSKWRWIAVKNGGPMQAWAGYCITQEAPTWHETKGTMTATGTVDIAVPAGNNMVVGNSWTAPIDINALTPDDMEGITASIYFFNTGVDKEGTGGAAGSRYAGGTYVTIPVEVARYVGDDDHINSMQGFFVKNTSGSDGVLHLDYDRHVRGTTRGSIIGDALHAPARRTALSSDEPVVLKMKVSGENYDDKLLLLEREDFTEGFDNGWDGDKWDGNESALYIYTTDSEGTENSVSAIPELEGTVIGFRAGEDDAYTLNFEYLNSDETLYLYDVENNTYTQIMTGMTYRFFTTDNEKHERFIITRSNGQEVATGVESTSGSLDRSKAKKLLIEEKMFIIVNGMLYDATGKVVK